MGGLSLISKNTYIVPWIPCNLQPEAIHENTKVFKVIGKTPLKSYTVYIRGVASDDKILSGSKTGLGYTFPTIRW